MFVVMLMLRHGGQVLASGFLDLQHIASNSGSAILSIYNNLE